MIIVLHYRDLRLEDNPALFSACKDSKEVVPLYVFNKKTMGKASRWWLERSLKDLQKRYKEEGSSLLIVEGEIHKVLHDFSPEVVYYNKSNEPKFVESISKYKGAKKEFDGNYLVSPEEIFTKAGGAYSVFTPFYKSFLKTYEHKKPLKKPKLPPVSQRCRFDFPRVNAGYSWKVGREGAMDLLGSFIAKKYERDRDFPSIEGTSLLSPHLHFGEISPREVWDKVDDAPYQRQLVWREFANYFLYHNPRVAYNSWKEGMESFWWNQNSIDLEKWQQGLTGYPIVDAGMRQLLKTGWMHNRLRLIVGSFLTKDLFIHWMEGAKWFWENLVDADLANNILGWQWVAGCGPDAAPYFRIFNPTTQGEKFDPEGDFIREFVPELAQLPKKWIHRPWDAPPDLFKKVREYPAPIVDHQEAREKALSQFQSETR